jgi:hypothetical protein
MKEAPAGTVVKFAQSNPLAIPTDAVEVRFNRSNSGGFTLCYEQTETRNPGKVVVLAVQTRKVTTTVYYSITGVEEARSVVHTEWDVEKPGIDPAEFQSHLSLARR